MKLGFAKTFTRTALASMLAASLALTPMTAQPARADDRANAIAAVTIFTLLLGGMAAAASRDRDRDRDHGDWGGHHGNRAKVLPSQCAMVVLKGQNRARYYRAGCLRNNFAGWRQLPERCFERLDVRNGRDIRAYKGRCLARFGYRDERRADLWD
ncbi:hypothetical protein [Maritimibacter fusiformis]|uniref:Uncharacterized protein n=1 Tax=Maritimibacter fusiformis TaxID=2603819 RepID=A0A5D0RAU9_9RHOB|nr:hypothetical protein [Maritimibacter fusiformis]TYB77828.1 hypothetical protein FVF75_16420 [Maritimibacter fusiformis]